MTIYEALLAVQKEIEPISKSETNPFFKSKYFDINALLGALKPVLNKHGLVITQGLGHVNGTPALVTTVRTDKEKEDYYLPLPQTADAQKFGAMITYMRRFAYQSLFSLEAEDDDGNTASGKVAQPFKGGIVSQTSRPVAPVKPPVTQNDEDVPFN